MEVNPPANIVEENCDDKEDENDGGDSQHETTEEEPDFSSDGTYEPDTENDTASEQEDDANFPGNRFILQYMSLLSISDYFDYFKQQKKCTLPDHMHTCMWMIIRQPGLGKQSQQVTSRLSGERYDKFILFSQSCGAKLEF